ncbi:MAG: hypothetical protein BRC40_15480 [Cyanobacteria bacterium QH_8_48_120]|jgi:hypothetical protein|nr:MAG: hypothetical protein BRC35_10265 [Cyanobacteria bacterium QH_10_48_56]PSO63215.1 MAG: hypothetical protein BRC36_08625 [Cyanobacteria bacterium QH_2_48_84]PSO69349.1 MAG: hypothetical protein BRC40_15480 [Cyanobacteria bacterium QH_8_48_120]PSO77904.1 MAG: hypothetical protein BRC37_01635 [Cyanobacteria bacterium QH_3_48_40]PSO88420.1 MAG: hypothetical protein BRC43_06795 [Cyanobacteria bacterium QS_3_48_167]PSO89117.1 MAG: hypothetical protein BRC41_01815 [Cyanobacteria bacterium QH_9
MSDSQFHSQLDLEREAVKLGKQAMEQGLIPSFIVHYFPDVWHFYIPNENESDALTPEQAYLQLKKVVEQS